MKIYFDTEGLIESNRLYFEEEEAPYSLFSSVSSVYPFVKYEEELAEINDYCCFILCQLENKLKELIKDSDVPFELVKSYQREKQTKKDLNDIFDPAYMFSMVNTWEKLSRDINKCTLLLLILSYLESSLNEIAKWFCGECSIPLRQKDKGSSAVAFYLKKIGECCRCDLIKALENELKYLDKVRKIRNQFVHSEWEQMDGHYDKFRLCDVFNAASKFLTEIENAACNAGIIGR